MPLGIRSNSATNPNDELSPLELKNAIEKIADFKYIVSWNEASPTVSPDGSDHLARDTKFGVTFPFKAEIVGVYLTLDTAVTYGNAANDYTINLLNGSTLLLSAAQSLGTVAAGTKTYVPANQNVNFEIGDTVKLRLNQLDGASAAPTDLSSAKVFVEVVYKRR